jgi:hypothetical protein
MTSIDQFVSRFRVWILGVLGALMVANQATHLIGPHWLSYLGFALAFFSTLAPKPPAPPAPLAA